MSYIIDTKNGLSLGKPYSTKIVRTSDNTIHVLLGNSQEENVWCYYSHDNGVTWSRKKACFYNFPCSITKDSNDNLIGVFLNTTTDYTYFLKAPVDKTNPNNWTWDWNWSNAILIEGPAGYDISHADIVSDSNDYYHILRDRDWFRSINGGSSWIKTANVFPALTWGGIIKDSENNLYIIGMDKNANKIKGRKITYDGGTSWTVGSIYDIGSTYASEPQLGGIGFTTDERIIFSLFNPFYDRVEFARSTNPRDLSAMDDQIVIGSCQDYYKSDYTLSVVSDSIFIFYFRNNNLYCKFSQNNGDSFGAEILIFDDTYTNNYPRTPRGNNINNDLIWRRGSANPYSVIYNSPLAVSAGQIKIGDTTVGLGIDCERILAFDISESADFATKPILGRKTPTIEGEIFVTSPKIYKITARVGKIKRDSLQTEKDNHETLLFIYDKTSLDYVKFEEFECRWAGQEEHTCDWLVTITLVSTQY